MKTLLILSLLLGLSASAADLKIKVLPENPVLITNPSPGFTTPYFFIDKISAAWAGSGPLYVHTVSLTSPATIGQVNCVIKNANMKVIFPDFANRSGLVFIEENQSFYSKMFICEGVKVPVGHPYVPVNIPVSVDVVGIAALTGTEVVGHADITIH